MLEIDFTCVSLPELMQDLQLQLHHSAPVQPSTIHPPWSVCVVRGELEWGFSPDFIIKGGL